MQAMVDKYSNDFPTHTPGPGSSELRGDIVLVTGTTGALGCYLLAQLAKDSTISQIYAINRMRRTGQNSLLEAQKSALVDRGLDPEAVFNSEKVHLLEADVSVAGFSLPEDTYEKVLSEIPTYYFTKNGYRFECP